MRKRGWMCLFWSMLLVWCALPVCAMDTAARVVRVAYPVQAGLTDFDEYGNYTGYTYEYLEEVAQYTGWEYEFVEVPGEIDESLSALLEMLQNGEVDLMGAMVYSESLGELYDYASHSYGVSETLLQVPYETVQEAEINSQVYQVLRVAAIGQGTRLIREFEDYCVMNLIEPQYVYCETSEEQVQAVREGRADVLLNSGMNYIEGMRTVAKFSPKPFYFATTKGNSSGLIEELNAAIVSIEQADPSFSTNLYEKYFSPPNEKLFLTGKEKNYIENAGKIKVGVLKNQPPYQYLGEDGQEKGMALDFLAYVSEHTGLSFELVYYDTPEQAYEAAQNQEVSLVACMPYEYALARSKGVSMSRAYLSSQYLLVTREDGGTEQGVAGRRLALTNAATYQGKLLGEPVSYDTAEQCISAVAKGEADYTYMDAYTAQYYVNMPEYQNLKMIPQSYEPRKICFGVAKAGDPQLLSILNKCINTISEEDSQAIINSNTLQKQPFSLGNFLRANPLETVVFLVAFFLLVIVLLLLFLRHRAKAGKRLALELEKHFRIYALVSEYFFEYDFQDGRLMVTLPREGGKPEIVELDFSKPLPGRKDWGRDGEFLDLIRSGRDGVWEMEAEFIDGKTHWVRIALETVRDGGRPVYALGKINIIDGEKREKDTLQEKAQLDSLTHIYNAEACRLLVTERLARKAENEGSALLLLDVDHFKEVNDTYGHLRGDQSLEAVARLLQANAGEGDIVGRPGGDEFIVYLAHVEDTEMLEKRCGQLCEGLRSLLVAGKIKLTASVGAVFCTGSLEYSALYELADQALYQTKRAGRDGYRISRASSSAGDLDGG